MNYSIFLVIPCLLYFINIDKPKQEIPLKYDSGIEILSYGVSKSNQIADSLYRHSENNKQEMYSLFLMSVILEKQGKRMEAISNALKALQISIIDEDYSLQSRIYKFLSKQYRVGGLHDKGKALILEALNTSSLIKDKTAAAQFKAMASLELVEYEILAKNYDTAIEFLQLARFVVEQQEVSQMKYIDLANCEEVLGRCYMGLGDKDNALFHFTKAKDFIEKTKLAKTVWAADIYNSLILVYMDLKQSDSAKVYFGKKLLLTGQTQSEIKYVYKDVSNFRKSMDSLDVIASQYKMTFLENKAKETNLFKENYIEANNVVTDSIGDEDPSTFRIMSSIFLFILPTFMIYYKRKELLVNLERLFRSNDNKPGVVICSIKTEKVLLAKLDVFENSDVYLDKNMSVSTLVTQLHTNVKYLRFLLKKYKKSDYTTYINRLRIYYILNKLNSDKDYLNYKISFLADESGFSSHSKFSTNFKKFTNQSPSDYINLIKRKSHNNA